MTFRKIVFWSHLVGGVAAGLLIGIMSFTGAALTFDKEITAWAERDARRINSPAASAARLPLEELLRRVHASEPTLTVANLTVSSDPNDAVTFGVPGNRTFCVDPVTGAVREALAPRTRAFMQTMRDWHTRLNFALTPGRPSLGAELNGAANLAFVILALSGLVLWWPSVWNLRVLRPSLWFIRGARGRARDWNWHNAIGFWSLPLILVLAGTGIVMSYRWANDLAFTLSGETPPATLVPPPPPPLRLDAPPAGEPPLSFDALIVAAQKLHPQWQQITLRFNPPRASGTISPTPRTFALAVKENNAWPLFDVVTETLDTYSGKSVRTQGYATLSPGLQTRRWIRLLHSGEALGRFVQVLSGLACVAGCVLVYTGLALAWRRFFGSRSRETEPTAKA